MSDAAVAPSPDVRWPAGTVVPDYGGACISSLTRALLSPATPAPAWLPEPLVGAEQVVLLIVDGLGALQLDERRSLAPAMSEMQARRLTTVAPSTTAAALTSIATGRSPAEHGLLGYRLREGAAVLNVLKWEVANRDMRPELDPVLYQPELPFFGRPVPVVSRTEFEGSGFTEAHLRGVALHGWSAPSSIAVGVRRLLAGGATFVYAYYDGLDRIAHERGLGEYYDAELRAVDHLVAELLEVLPQGAALAVCADHGEMELTEPPIDLELLFEARSARYSGEGRFRWLEVAPDEINQVLASLRGALGERAIVMQRDELIATGLYGGPLSARHAARLGDIALIASDAISFLDPADPGEAKLQGRHGGLSPSEMYVPLLGWRR